MDFGRLGKQLYGRLGGVDQGKELRYLAWSEIELASASGLSGSEGRVLVLLSQNVIEGHW
jgi:hypothetical protein